MKPEHVSAYRSGRIKDTTTHRTSKPLILLVCFTAILLLEAATSAASEVGFMVSPTSVNSTIAVGDETNESITLQNLSTEEIVVNAHVSANGDNGEPVISVEPTEVSLKPGGSAQVVIHVDVPADAQTGKRVSAVLFDAVSSNVSDVSIVGRVAVALTIDVIIPVSDVTWSYPHIIDSTDPVVFQMEGRNTGNFTTRLEGKVDISGLFSNRTLKATSDPVVIGETTQLQVIWDETPLLAIKRVTLDLGSGIGAPVEQRAFLIIFPWKLTLILMLIVVIAVAGARFQPFFPNVFSRKGRRGEQD